MGASSNTWLAGLKIKMQEIRNDFLADFRRDGDAGNFAVGNVVFARGIADFSGVEQP